MTTSATPSDANVHTLQCMEVWGGNRAIDNAVSVPGIDAWIVSGVYHDDEHGGDVHYVSMCGAGQISRFLVADVAGHGSAVDDLAQTLRRLMRKNINTLDQTRFARSLNHEFAAAPGADPGKFATALLSTYHAPSDHLIVTNAGHPRPLWYHTVTGAWTLLDEQVPQRAETLANLPLGIIEPTEYDQFAVELARDDLVLIYTDSLIESKSPDGKLLGEDGLLELVRKLDVTRPENIAGALIDALDQYRGGNAPDDDQTLLLLHHNAVDPPRMSLGQKLSAMGKMIGLIGH